MTEQAPHHGTAPRRPGPAARPASAVPPDATAPPAPPAVTPATPSAVATTPPAHATPAATTVPPAGPPAGAPAPGRGPGAAAAPAPDAEERAVLCAVVTALLREDAYGLRGRSRPDRRPDGDWLHVPVGEAGRLALPVGPDGFLSDTALRRPLVEHHPAGGTAVRTLTTLDAVLAVLRHAVTDEPDRYDTFVTECRAELAAARHLARIRPQVLAGLASAYGDRPAERWTGLTGALAYDTLAAFRAHPVHPTGRARHGLAPHRQAAYAPETHPVFPVRWVLLPRAAVTGDTARLPGWWPPAARLGHPALDHSHLALPVHPLTAEEALPAALETTGLAPAARWTDPAGHPRPLVRPTLSMRTVAVTDDPAVHLKLPLPTATLGALNRRTVKPGTLTDGAVAQRLMEEVRAREPALARTLLLADETGHLHAGHELLAVLVRRYPAGLDRCQVVPVAALPAATPAGPPVAVALAEHFYGGDLTAFLGAYLDTLFTVHTLLFGHGVALEAHQQNTSVVLDRPGGGRPRLRLLIKDHDGPRVHPGRLAAALGPGGARRAAALCRFDDPRITVGTDGPLADVFTTITVHLCAAAPLHALAAAGSRRPPAGLLRDRLAAAVARLGTTPGSSGAVLRARLFDADHLPVKAMVTAGTLYSKRRSGAADINKHYTSGPNYLRRAMP
ncbi:IucA/IucC family protein [Streptomyces pactum]|uniref:IucA/IucC family protein n=1 Tax=Streptomyces pactum TaxID=68249 RepID=UPI0036FE5C56